MEEEHASGRPAQLAAVAGLDVKEELCCAAEGCGRTTHHNQYVQYYHNAQVGVLLGAGCIGFA